MSNDQIVPDDAEREKDSALLQVLLAEQVTAGCRDLEETTYDVYKAEPSDRNLWTWQFVQNARRRAEAKEDLCRLQLAAVS